NPAGIAAAVRIVTSRPLSPLDLAHSLASMVLTGHEAPLTPRLAISSARTNGRICNHRLSRRPADLPGAADPGTLHSALVRRRPRCVDDVSVVLSTVVARGLRLRSLAGDCAAPCQAAHRAPFAAGRITADAADRTESRHVEAGD